MVEFIALETRNFLSASLASFNVSAPLVLRGAPPVVTLSARLSPEVVNVRFYADANGDGAFQVDEPMVGLGKFKDGRWSIAGVPVAAGFLVQGSDSDGNNTPWGSAKSSSVVRVGGVSVRAGKRWSVRLENVRGAWAVSLQDASGLPIGEAVRHGKNFKLSIVSVSGGVTARLTGVDGGVCEVVIVPGVGRD